VRSSSKENSLFDDKKWNRQDRLSLLCRFFPAKTRKLKGLRKESDKAKIILLSFFHLVRDLILLCIRGNES
jgi:hypothetical protein